MKSKIMIMILAICLVLIMGCEDGEREDFYDLKGNKISKLEFNLNGENGTIVVYYGNGNKKAAITIINGDPKREIEWYENGKKRIERVYTESFSDWKEITWYENGQKKKKRKLRITLIMEKKYGGMKMVKSEVKGIISKVNHMVDGFGGVKMVKFGH